MMRARSSAAACALAIMLAAPFAKASAAAAQAVTAVPTTGGLSQAMQGHPGPGFLGDAFRSVTRAQTAAPSSPATSQASALYDLAKTRYRMGDVGGGERAAALARGYAEGAAAEASATNVPLLRSTVDSAQRGVPRYVSPGLPSLEVTKHDAHATDPKIDFNPCDSIDPGSMRDKCNAAMKAP